LVNSIWGLICSSIRNHRLRKRFIKKPLASLRQR
jgi:hypothetical protein